MTFPMGWHSTICPASEPPVGSRPCACGFDAQRQAASSQPSIVTPQEDLTDAEHGLGHMCQRGWIEPDQPCLPWLLAARAEKAEADRDEALAKVAAVRAVHARYFDMDGKPGWDDTTPEPEDVWRYDRDLRAALGEVQR